MKRVKLVYKVVYWKRIYQFDTLRALEKFISDIAELSGVSFKRTPAQKTLKNHFLYLWQRGFPLDVDKTISLGMVHFPYGRETIWAEIVKADSKYGSFLKIKMEY